jgi:cbb3-type cytochrome oxidase cytochrome c subunit
MTKIRYGAGGVPYVEKTIETEKADLEASYKQSIANKKERTKKKKKKVIQEIMGDDLKEQKETLDEII